MTFLWVAHSVIKKQNGRLVTLRYSVSLQKKKNMLKSGCLFASKRLTPVLEISEQILKGQFCFTIKRQNRNFTTILPTKNAQVRLCVNLRKPFHTGFALKKSSGDDVEKFDNERSLLYHSEFDRFQKKDKKAFFEVVRIYQKNTGKRSGHVEFIKAALNHMKEFGVHRDLETYKKILDVLPKGVYIATNRFLVSGMYFPRQQFVILDLLRQMGHNGVMPDAEFGIMLTNIFGRHSYPYQKFGRMLYWSLKWKNKSPFPIPRPLPVDTLELAKLVIQRITSVDIQTEISIFKTEKVEESIDKTWIVSGQSPKQKMLLKKHPKDVPVIVEEGNLVWLLDKSINYFILKADGEPLPYNIPEDTDDISKIQSKFFNPNYVEKEEIRTVHEQDDGIIYAVCATGTSSRDSLLSWIRILQKTGNPVLEDLPVLFRFKQAENLPEPFSQELVKQ